MTDTRTTHNASDDERALRQLLDLLPIYATRIGYRDDSTPNERAFADSLFRVHTTWCAEKDNP